MPIPYFRYVQYENDGVSLYQCLSCYEYLNSTENYTYFTWKFCPKCGKENKGLFLCRPKNAPKHYQVKNPKEIDDFYPPYDEDEKFYPKKQPQTYWLIEKVVNFIPPCEWVESSSKVYIDFDGKSAKNALWIIKSMRNKDKEYDKEYDEKFVKNDFVRVSIKHETT